MRETGGGHTPIGTTKRQPLREPPQSLTDAERAENAHVLFAILLGIGVCLAIAVPINFLHLPATPLRRVESRGYFLSYVAPIGGKTPHANIYIGRGSDGRCHVANEPVSWDIGLCDVRLRQIEAMDCNAVPQFNDEHCQAMPLRASIVGVRRPVHLEFIIGGGEPTTVVELPE